MSEQKKYTAQEMRNSADNCDWRTHPCIAAMLRQAADAEEELARIKKVIDDELKKQELCRKCEWRGRNIRGESACPCPEENHGVVFDIDVTDRILRAARGEGGAE